MKFLKIDNQHKPIIHFITNYVTANDLANITSILGASPLMADEIKEMDDITSFIDCLVINIGTINEYQFESIKLACKNANYRKIPIILDPVGVACSGFRQEVIKSILNNFHISVIKGNITEINYLVYSTKSSTGIDAENNLDKINIQDMQKFCALYETTLVITGSDDYIIDKQQTTTLTNGCDLATKLVGTGCMLGAVIGVYCSIAKGDYYHACIQATSTFNIAMELAKKAIQDKNNIGNFRVQLFDILGNLNEEIIQKNIKTK